jgi:glutathione synthase/RimK-type ligase-like ATP-grasp enzyme
VYATTAMNKILVMSRREERPEFDTAESMVTKLEAANGQAEYDACYLDDICFVYDGKTLEISNHRTGTLLEDYDAVLGIGWFKEKIFEEVALAVALYTRAHKRLFLNSEAYVNRSKSKVSQYVLAVLENIQTTPFCFALDHAVLLSSLQQSGINYPFIMKAPLASRGNDNYLVQDAKQLNLLLEENPDTAFVIQEFIPNDGDLRLIVVGNAVGLAIERTAVAGSHLNNTSKGGSACLVDLSTLSSDMLEQAVAMAQLLHREITGVDMIIHKETGKHYFLEANNMPQLSTGSLVDEKIAVVSRYLDGLVSINT